MSATLRHEPTAWMRGQLDLVLSTIDRLGLDEQTVVTTLNGSGGREERRCDRCRRDVPVGPPFFVDCVSPRPGVHVVVGLCQGCRGLERGEQV